MLRNWSTMLYDLNLFMGLTGLSLTNQRPAISRLPELYCNVAELRSSLWLLNLQMQNRSFLAPISIKYLIDNTRYPLARLNKYSNPLVKKMRYPKIYKNHYPNPLVARKITTRPITIFQEMSPSWLSNLGGDDKGILTNIT